MVPHELGNVLREQRQRRLLDRWGGRVLHSKNWLGRLCVTTGASNLMALDTAYNASDHVTVPTPAWHLS